jgi:hypothetical protein
MVSSVAGGRWARCLNADRTFRVLSSHVMFECGQDSKGPVIYSAAEAPRRKRRV